MPSRKPNMTYVPLLHLPRATLSVTMCSNAMPGPRNSVLMNTESTLAKMLLGMRSCLLCQRWTCAWIRLYGCSCVYGPSLHCTHTSPFLACKPRTGTRWWLPERGCLPACSPQVPPVVLHMCLCVAPCDQLRKLMGQYALGPQPEVYCTCVYVWHRVPAQKGERVLFMYVLECEPVGL